jgi:preprotein translocase subunit SecG
MLEAILSGLQVLFSVGLILLILLHSGKDAGLSGAFGVGGGSGPLGGGAYAERNLTRMTVALAVLWIGNVIALIHVS